MTFIQHQERTLNLIHFLGNRFPYFFIKGDGDMILRSFSFLLFISVHNNFCGLFLFSCVIFCLHIVAS